MSSKKILFESRKVGTIEVIEEDVVIFEPLPGFPDSKRFVLMEHSEGSELAWLVSLDDPALALVVAAPWSFFPNYDPPIERDHLATLGIEKRSEVEILSIVTLAGQSVNLNLAAPLLINVSTRRGLQVVSDDPRYTTRAPIPTATAVADTNVAQSAPKTADEKVETGRGLAPSEEIAPAP